MQFLDPYSRFQTLQGVHGTLHFSGEIGLTWKLALDLLDEGKFPADARGCFAFVYLPRAGSSSKVFAVDHLCTIPLFYSQKFVSYHYSTIAAAEHGEIGRTYEFDREFFWESQLFWGYTVSERTVLRNIKRVCPGHYRKNDRSIQYLDLRNEMGEAPLKLDEFRATLEAIIEKKSGERNAMLVSGGTDSATLMAAVSKLGIQKRFKIVSVRSDVEMFKETSLIESLAAKLDLHVHFFSAKTIRIQREPQVQAPPSEMFLWKDYSFYYRRQAVESIDDGRGFHAVFTGECGDQLFGGPKLAKQIPLILQNGNWGPRDLARQYLHLSMREAFGEWQGYLSSPLVDMYLKADPLFRTVYEEMIERIAVFFDSMTTPDVINRLLNINLVFKGPYRMFHYSQDAYRFVHPFSQWEMVRLALRTRSDSKVYNKGRLKEAFYQAYKDRLIDDIWEAPKIGTAIPIR